MAAKKITAETLDTVTRAKGTIRVDPMRRFLGIRGAVSCRCLDPHANGVTFAVQAPAGTFLVITLPLDWDC